MSHADSAPVHHLLGTVQSVADERETLTLGEVMDKFGHHSFAPALVLIGMVMMVPGPADIPGVPTLLGMLVVIVAAQLAFGRDHLWIPDWLERREVKSSTVEKMVSWLQKPADWLDSLTKQRYEWLLNHATVTVIAVACILIAMTTPVLEFIPFSANAAGAAIFAFSLAIMSRDGLLAGAAIVMSIVTATLVIFQFTG